MPRFLFVAPVYAASAKTGGGQRTGHLFRSVAALGEVDVWLMSEPAFADVAVRGTAEFAETFVGAKSVRVVTSTPALCTRRSLVARAWHAVQPPRRVYRPEAATFDELREILERRRIVAVVGRYLHATAVSGALHQTQVPVVADLDDIEEVVSRAERSAPATSRSRRLRLLIDERRSGPVLRALRRRCSHLFVASTDDAPLVEHPSVSVLPNIPATEPSEEAPASDGAHPVVLFVGSHGHDVNRSGLARFVERCWPAIRQCVPSAVLRIVGSGGWESARDVWEAHPGVFVVGQAERMAPEYAAAAFAVAPLYEGAGTKIKVLEALSYARAIVASAHAARGFDDLLGHGLVATPTDAAMVEACIDLLRNPEARAQARQGQALVASLYSFGAFESRVHNGLAVALRPHRANG